MAEGILFGLAQKIIENLASQLFQEIGSLWGVDGELEKIKNSVSTMQAVLLDAAMQQSHNHQVRDWLEKLKDAVYDADDLLSEFSTEAMRRKMVSGNKIAKEVRTCFSLSNPLAFRCKMSHRIKAMKGKLDAIAEDRKNYHLKENHVEANVVGGKREPTHSFVKGEDVIGREEDKNAIIDLLLDSNVEENVSVIPIVGMGGLGKSTLAQYVYNDEKVQNYFELKMWVWVYDVFELKIIIEKIIASATGDAPRNLEIDQLQSQLRENIIDRKKYLLVLDDVWNEDREKWLNLKCLLMGGSKGSKIIITTRVRLVAEITLPDLPFIDLKGLSKEQSWVLFRQRAFKKGQENNNPKLVTVGREIVEMCQGVPLAIKVIGNALYFKKKESEWLSVKNNLLANITQEGNATFSILKLSYDHLPPHLKTCFEFCSLFPKNYKIDKETVIQLWRAQGFIQSSNDELSEDVGNEYFNDLFLRSFFEEVTRDLTYKMHDLIHDLAKIVAGKECKLVDFDGKNIHEKTRHVSCPFSIDSPLIETLRSSVKGVNIRTFLLTGEMYRSNALDKSTLNALISSFKRLRALDLHKLQITRVPNSIGKLIYLKYLDLSSNEDIETLPDSITTLLNLETLKLYGCAGLKELPKGFRRLVNLKHLYNGGCSNLSHMPRGLGQMTSLQILQLFIVSTSSHIGGVDELNQLHNLRGMLEITHLERLKEANLESKVANLSEKKCLEKIILKWDRRDQVDDNEDEKSLEDLQPHQNLKYLEVYRYAGVRLSRWLSSLINLVALRLESCKRCQHLPPLSQLPSLKCLELDTMNDLEYISDSDISEEVLASSTTLSTPFFPLLESLKIWNCPNLLGWWRIRRDLVATTSTSTPNHKQDRYHHSLPLFPLLSSLSIYNCPNLTSMPLFPYLESPLYLGNVSLKPLQETMAMTSLLPSSSSSSSSTPLSKLNRMCLDDIEDIESFPAEWAFNLNSLRGLSICDCHRLTSMSGAIQYLTSLWELVINDCEEFDPLTDMHDDGMEWKCLNCLRDLRFDGVPKLKFLPAGLQHVTTLKVLHISNCPNLMGLQHVTTVKELCISNCPNLMTLPELTSLEYLQIERGGPNLRSLPNGIHCLTSLRSLIIKEFPNLMTLPEWISNLTSLEVLEIAKCPNFTSLPAGMRHLNCLRSLYFKSILNPEPLLASLQYVTTLKHLTISECSNLRSLPELISELTSLERLVIALCHNLTSLPDGIRRLKSLRELTIIDCPQLAEKCQKESGEDWPKIAHVPILKIITF